MCGQDNRARSDCISGVSTTVEKLNDPIFAPIEFEVDVDQRTARLFVPGVTEGRGEPIVNPVTGQQHRARIDLPHGFEYSLAEVGRGWTTASGPIQMKLTDTYGQFANIPLESKRIVH